METYSTLMEQARKMGVVRNQNVQQWLEWRGHDPELRDEPLEDYLNKMRFFRSNIVRADKREGGWIVDIDELDCYRIGQKQKWVCALTGDKLEFTRGGQEFMNNWCNPKSCTNDRINPEQHYHRDNLQLVTWEANLFKQGFTMSQMQILCVKIAKKQNWC